MESGGREIRKTIGWPKAVLGAAILAKLRELPRYGEISTPEGVKPYLDDEIRDDCLTDFFGIRRGHTSPVIDPSQWYDGIDLVCSHTTRGAYANHTYAKRVRQVDSYGHLLQQI